MPRENPLPGEIEAVYGDARDDLDRLVDATRRQLEKTGPASAAIHMTSGLLDQPSWDRVLLASVVGAAAVRLAGMVDEEEGPCCLSVDEQVREAHIERDLAVSASTDDRKASSKYLSMFSNILAEVPRRLESEEHPRDVLNWVTAELEKVIPF